MNMLKINLETKQFLKQKGFIKLLQLLAKVKVQLWDQFPKDWVVWPESSRKKNGYQSIV
jgi:hypothetical protein